MIQGWRSDMGSGLYPQLKEILYPMDFKLHRDGKGTNPWGHR